MMIKVTFNATLLFMAVGLFAACSNDNFTEVNKKEAKKTSQETTQGVKFAINDTKASAKSRVVVNEDGTKTRTIFTHTPGQGADAFWVASDFIWVQDKTGAWQKSTHTELHDGSASAEFTLPGVMSDYADGCAVRYTGTYGTGTELQITDYQVNYTPNDFSMGDMKGDCGVGVARATGNPVKFNFTLNHLVSYLCFLPRCTNAELGKNILLKNINITATPAVSGGASALAGIFHFSADGQHLEGDRQLQNKTDLPITDFRLTNTTDNQALNACYAMVPAGYYNFTIRYSVNDVTTGVYGTFIKQINNVVCDEGVINDFRIDIASGFKNYSSKYYMWDVNTANDDAWHNYEAFQPTVSGQQETAHYPSNPADWRWHNTLPYPAQATRHSSLAPSVNGIRWIVERAETWYDEETAWTTMGHLYKGGVWVKLPTGYTDAAAPNGQDYRSNSLNGHIVNGYTHQVRPTNTTGLLYFPLLGWYENGKLIDVGKRVGYWTSSSRPEAGYSYVLYFTNQNNMDVSNPYWKRTYALKNLTLTGNIE